MKKTIVIPTDFTVNSLNTLKAVLSSNPSGTSLDIILLHGMNLSDSIRDLLFFSKMKHIDALSNAEFEEAREVLCNKFDSHINSLKTDLFTGFNQSAFNSYLEANRIDKIYIPDSKENLPNKNSFDLSGFIKKSAVEVITINTDAIIPVPEKGKITEVFLNQVSIS